MYTVYGTDSCPWCDRAIEILEKLGKGYQHVDVGEDEAAQNMFREEGLRSVPQVYFEGYRIGGFEALKKHLKS